jgi:5-methylthioribose kinase
MIAFADPNLFDVEDVTDIAVYQLGCDRASLRVDSLVGGVSAVIFLVSDGSGRRYVIKQARTVLDVPDLWTADPRRAHFEARALTLMGSLTPGGVPDVVAVLLDQHAIVLTAAPSHWVNYKSALLEGTARSGTSSEVALTLAALHSGTRDDVVVRASFDRQAELQSLRIEPWFEASVIRNPDLAELMTEAAAILRRPGRCLVHGDVTPKNVLGAPDAEGSWLLDPEVAHFGQPEFDAAMWCSHLLLKIHSARSTPQELVARTALAAFISTYAGQVEASLLNDDSLGLLIPAVCQARLFGKSRVEYREDVDVAALNVDLAAVMNSPGGSMSTLERIGGDIR